MIARVVVDTPLAHLDRLFDYLVPDEMHVVEGCRVKVRFAGRMVDGFVVELAEESEFAKLAPIAKVISTESVLSPESYAVVRAVADRYAGTVSDVLRLAIPKRHARAENAARPERPAPLPLVERRRPTVPRMVWSATPADDPPRFFAHQVLAALHTRKGSVVVVPDVRDVARWDAVFTDVLGVGRHVTLTAAQSPEARYKAFLAAARGDVQVVLGTRAAAYAPVDDLGLVALWDDGDDLLAEPRSPYPHAREVLLIRAQRKDAGVLLGGHARTAEGQSLVRSGWCTSFEPDPDDRRRAWPRVDVDDGSESGSAPIRLPGRVVRAIREAGGPVLVQVPRRGYRSALSCQSCREPVRCTECQGRMSQPSAAGPLVCRWCNVSNDDWECVHCGGTTLRSPVIGHLRTAEEFARTFPTRTVLTSAGDSVLDGIDNPNALVLATPGAEPVAADGYALVVLLDTWLMLARDDFRVVEESHRRWFNALALTGFGGKAIAVGEPGILQALVRADPVGLAERELDERAATHLPPAARLATLSGPAVAIDELATRAWTSHTEVLGPVPVDEKTAQLILRAPRAEGMELAGRLKDLQAERSAAKLPAIRVQVDPLAL